VSTKKVWIFNSKNNEKSYPLQAQKNSNFKETPFQGFVSFYVQNIGFSREHKYRSSKDNQTKSIIFQKRTQNKIWKCIYVHIYKNAVMFSKVLYTK
jgi:hypothetical protein